MPRAKLEALVQRRILSLGPITMGQLGSEYILKMLQGNKERFQKQEIAEHLLSKVLVAKRAGLRLEDRLANRSTFPARLDHFLQYCVDRQMLTKDSLDVYVIKRGNVTGSTGSNYWHSPIQCSHNELLSLREMYTSL